jgi:hypothetical protein
VNNKDNKKLLSFYKINHSNIINSQAITNIALTSFDDFCNLSADIIKSNTKNITIKEKFNKPFMDKTIYNYISIRENYRKLKSRYNSNITITERFKFYRNKVTSLIRSKKKKLNEKIFEENLSNPRKT